MGAPSTYKLVATLGNGSNAEFVCTSTAAPTSVGSVTVEKNASTITAKVAKVKAGKTAKIKVKVVAPNEVPTGKVVATIGAKKVAKGMLDAKGKVVLKVKAKFLKKATTKVKVSYAGDGFTTDSKVKTSITPVS